MILAFHLSMPNRPTWDGNWSGAGRKYVVTRSFRGRSGTEKAESILAEGYYHYQWPDGWGAGIQVEEVDSRRARQLRKQSAGFCGYEWMVDTICLYGKPMASHEVEEYLKS